MQDSDKPVSLLMIDVDHFKRINDTYGHAAGDEVICEVGQRILRNIRGFDLAARYGGEEFVVVMPDTPMEVALAVAERLCRRMANEPVSISDASDRVRVTVSIGVAESRNKNDTAERLLKLADDALYEAKDAGRNQVIPTPDRAAHADADALPG
jgi:two-component system cell cycle response regulator